MPQILDLSNRYPKAQDHNPRITMQSILTEIIRLSEIWKEAYFDNKKPSNKRWLSMSDLISRSDADEKYDDLVDFMYQLPYEILWKIECCAMVGYDLYYESKFEHANLNTAHGYSYFDHYGNVSLKDFETLAKIYSIPRSIEAGGNKGALIEYVCGKIDLDLHLKAYLQANDIHVV